MDSVLYRSRKPCFGDDMSLVPQENLSPASAAGAGSLVVGGGEKSIEAHPTANISVEEYERLVLSPPPVPLNLEAACAAIQEAACRSSSRSQSISGSTRSLKTSRQEGCPETHSDHSARSSGKLSTTF
ncbi:unnamed protein product [Heterobilharzia americana]|nr:unnamed protein product [Heterobilharzia americana]